MTLTFGTHLRSCISSIVSFTLTIALIGCASAPTGGYQQTNLISNTLHEALRTQRSLIPWGLEASPGEGFVIVNNGTGSFATYDNTGDELSLAALVAGPPELQANRVPQQSSPTRRARLSPQGAAFPARFCSPRWMGRFPVSMQTVMETY
jgi:hypothetical protein